MRPITLFTTSRRKGNPRGIIQKLLQQPSTPLLIHTAILLGLITGADHAGTSNLFAAYLTGVVISWWDTEVPLVNIVGDARRIGSIPEPASPESPAQVEARNGEDGPPGDQDFQRSHNIIKRSPPTTENATFETSGQAIYVKFYQQSVERISSHYSLSLSRRSSLVLSYGE